MPIKALIQSMLGGINTHLMSTQNPHCVTAGQLGLTGLSYTDRGDPASWDFSKADLSTDGAWHVLDLSPIVPDGVALIHLAIRAASAYNNQTIVFCKNGLVNKLNGLTIRVPHGGNQEYYKAGWVACGADRKLDYWTNNITWQALDVLIRGWL